MDMPTICPTITVETAAEFTKELTRLKKFAPRLHLDLADGTLAPRVLLSPAQLYLPDEIPCDIHVMTAAPSQYLPTLIGLKPHAIILHVEATEDIVPLMQQLKAVKIKAGVAILPETAIKAAAERIKFADHVLIFAGHLGFQGGTADLRQLERVAEIRMLNPRAEISWDGGINEVNIATIAKAGVKVLNVGGFIHHAARPAAAYAKLQQALALV